MWVGEIIGSLIRNLKCFLLESLAYISDAGRIWSALEGILTFHWWFAWYSIHLQPYVLWYLLCVRSLLVSAKKPALVWISGRDLWGKQFFDQHTASCPNHTETSLVFPFQSALLMHTIISGDIIRSNDALIRVEKNLRWSQILPF